MHAEHVLLFGRRLRFLCQFWATILIKSSWTAHTAKWGKRGGGREGEGEKGGNEEKEGKGRERGREEGGRWRGRGRRKKKAKRERGKEEGN